MLCPATAQAVAAIPEPTRGEILRVATTEDSRQNCTFVREQQKQQFAAGEQPARTTSSRCKSWTWSSSSAASG